MGLSAWLMYSKTNKMPLYVHTLLIPISPMTLLFTFVIFQYFMFLQFLKIGVNAVLLPLFNGILEKQSKVFNLKRGSIKMNFIKTKVKRNLCSIIKGLIAFISRFSYNNLLLLSPIIKT